MVQELVEIGIGINVNNNRKIGIFQKDHDGEITVITYSKDENEENHYAISSGDFVTMLNWYRFQKQNGNERLEF